MDTVKGPARFLLEVIRVAQGCAVLALGTEAGSGGRRMTGSEHFRAYDKNLRRVLLFDWLRDEHAARLLKGLQERNAELSRRILADAREAAALSAK